MTNAVEVIIGVGMQRASLDFQLAQCGMSSTSFKIAPAIRLCMSELILDGEVKSVDISIHRPKRFEEGAEIKGNYVSFWH